MDSIVMCRTVIADLIRNPEVRGRVGGRHTGFKAESTGRSDGTVFIHPHPSPLPSRERGFDRLCCFVLFSPSP